MSIGVDHAGCRPDALQPDRLPHQQQFLVYRRHRGSRIGRAERRVDDQHVAGSGAIDRGLDAGGGQHVSRRLAADRDGHRVDGLLAVVAARDDQLAAPHS